jgi:hypothetical protein
MTDQNKRVLVLSEVREGKVYDKRQLNEEKLADFVPDNIPIHVDLGFQGLQNEFVNIKIPDKKPRGKELTQEQKQSNRDKSSDVLSTTRCANDNPFGERVKCEHTISGIKRYKVATAVYKNHILDLDDRFMLMAAGLWNFYLMAA